MILDLEDRVKVAYKKLKQMVYFEKHPLTLRRRLAEFECDGDFEKRLRLVAKIAGANNPHETAEFKAWLEDIDFDLIPKSVESPVKYDDDQGSFVSNVTNGPLHKISKVNYMFDGAVELHLLSVLWLMVEGPEYDHILSQHCWGSRLHQFVGNDEDHSAYLFKKYHELYAKWRDSGIQKARDLLINEGRSICVVGLDVQEYYYRVQLDWEKLRAQIKRPVPSGPFRDFFKKRQFLGAKLFKCIEEICTSYRAAINPMLAITHPDLPKEATCLPIGLCISPVIANWYLKEFDIAILEKVRPAYYGRYVDDILMVVPTSKAPGDGTEAWIDPIMDFMDRILVSSGILKWDASEARYELSHRPGLYLQKKKCILQFFDAEYSTAGLDKFQKQIEDNASDFALLPVDGDESPVAQVAYDLLYDGSVNKFRNVKAVAENRCELAVHLAKQTQLHLMAEGSVDKDLKNELFRFFKGRNAIAYWDMWERVISFLVVAGDPNAAELFRKAMRSEIKKVNYIENDAHGKNHSPVSKRLRQMLVAHLESCMELSLAVTETTDEDGDAATRLWRESNLVRHHLVAIPLLNYTSFGGNLAAPENATGLAIDQRKVANTPRFVHVDECLGFVGSGCARTIKKDAVASANVVYKLFHGSAHEDVTSELIGGEDLK